MNINNATPLVYLIQAQDILDEAIPVLEPYCVVEDMKHAQVTLKEVREEWQKPECSPQRGGSAVAYSINGFKQNMIDHQQSLKEIDKEIQ